MPGRGERERERVPFWLKSSAVHPQRPFWAEGEFLPWPAGGCVPERGRLEASRPTPLQIKRPGRVGTLAAIVHNGGYAAPTNFQAPLNEFGDVIEHGESAADGATQTETCIRCLRGPSCHGDHHS